MNEDHSCHTNGTKAASCCLYLSDTCQLQYFCMQQQQPPPIEQGMTGHDRPTQAYIAEPECRRQYAVRIVCRHIQPWCSYKACKLTGTGCRMFGCGCGMPGNTVAVGMYICIVFGMPGKTVPWSMDCMYAANVAGSIASGHCG